MNEEIKPNERTNEGSPATAHPHKQIIAFCLVFGRKTECGGERKHKDRHGWIFPIKPEILRGLPLLRIAEVCECEAAASCDT